MNIFDNREEESKADFTFLSHSQDQLSLFQDIKINHDQIEKTIEKIKQAQNKTKECKKYIQKIRKNPQQLLNNPTGDQLRKKIELMTIENQKLKDFLKIAKKPIKTSVERFSFNKTPKSNLLDKQNIYGRESLQFFRPNNRRDILQEIDNNYEKVFTEVSTCQNYMTNKTQKVMAEKTLKGIEEMTQSQKRIKNGLKITLQKQLQQQQLLRNEIQILSNEGNTTSNSHLKLQNLRNLKIIEQYKNKLVSELKKSNLRENQFKKILQQLQINYNNEVDRYKELADMLQKLRSTKTDDITIEADLIQSYNETLRLESILKELNFRYQKMMSEQKRKNEQSNINLRNIKNELIKIIQKLGLKINLSGMSLNESIQMLCNQIINNVYIQGTKSMSNLNAKLLKIKQLSQMEKNNNSKIISELKGRQQALSKQLMQLKLNQSKQ